jgi:hypothetical protein
MKINTLIKHKEAIVVCEENEPISMNYNVLLTTPKANAGVKPTMTTKLALICANCGKTSHLVEICHNNKKIQIM